MLFATELCRIASNGFAPDEPKMLDLRETDGLFEHFEVNREPFWPVISRLLGGSIILHTVLGACIIFIPAVRDALSVAVMFRGAGFVDREYAFEGREGLLACSLKGGDLDDTAALEND